MLELLQMIALAFYNYEADRFFVGTENLLNVGCQELGYEAWEAERVSMSDEEAASWAALFDAEGHDIQYGVMTIRWTGDPEVADALAGHP